MSAGDLPADFQVFHAVVDQLKVDEGFRADPYKCTAGHLTIGYGTKLPITEGEAEMLLERRLADTRTALAQGLWNARAMPSIDSGHALLTFAAMPHAVQEALLNMAYQLGVAGLLGFKKMLVHLGERRWAQASEEMLASKWHGQTPARCERAAALMASAAASSA